MPLQQLAENQEVEKIIFECNPNDTVDQELDLNCINYLSSTNYNWSTSTNNEDELMSLGDVESTETDEEVIRKDGPPENNANELCKGETNAILSKNNVTNNSDNNRPSKVDLGNKSSPQERCLVKEYRD